MKYSHRSNYRKTCPHDPETRAQLGQRLHYARCKLGWSVEDAGKYFQVTDRTWHNWENGSHRIPYAVYKLARVLARLELPGEAWAGWRIEGDLLITPEGRQITPKDGSWWSLLIRQARCFRSAMTEMTRLRLLLNDAVSSGAGQVAPVRATPGTALTTPHAVTRGETPTNNINLTAERHQNDVTIETWPILYDYQTPLTPLHAPRPTTLVSASTLSFALPWTPTCEARVNLLRPDQSQSRSQQSQAKSQLNSLSKLPVHLNQSQTSPFPKSAKKAGGSGNASATRLSGDLNQTPKTGGKV